MRTLLIGVLSFAIVPLARAQDDPGDETSATAPATQAVEVRRGIVMSGDREQRSRQVYERIIAKVEPSLTGDVSRIPQYLDLFSREFVEDPRTFAFDVTHGTSDPTTRPVLRGHVEFAEHRAALATFFQHLKLDVDDRTEMLPSPLLGDRQHAFVTARRAYVYDRPTGERRERFTECAQGDRIYLLKEAENGHLLCHAADGYVGYIAADHVRRVTRAEVDEVERAAPVRRSEEIERVIAAARKLMGTPYVWGGSSSDGVDCSGLVRSSFRTVGVNLPRDADQQSLVGRLVATRWHRSALRRGDTLYFLGRRGNISHTALYLGDDRYIEATGPVVRITSFNPAHPEYVERRAESFCFGKRILE